jgi:hypothetical protein
VFGWGWKAAAATVVDKRALAAGRSEYILEVRPDDGSAPFIGTAGDPLDDRRWRPPEVGAAVWVRYRTSTRQLKFDRTDARHQPADEQRWQQQLRRTAAPLQVPGPGRAPVDPAERRADQAAMSAMTSDMAVTLEAIKRARAAEDEAEVSRLKDAYRLRAAVRNQSGHAPHVSDGAGDPFDRMARFERIAGLMRALVDKRSAPAAARIDLLERLAALRDRGVLTDDEFAAEKARILRS